MSKDAPGVSAAPSDGVRTVRIGLAAYLRAIWSLFWTAFVYPTKTTQIDLTTGRVVAHF